MTPSGFLQRTRKMQRILRGNTIDKWATGFIDLLERPIPLPNIRITRALGAPQTAELIADYHQARKRLILLDYDGTLEPIKKHPEDAKPSRATLAALKRLAKDPHNHVAVISGRDRTNLMEWLGSLPVTLVAEHGGFIRLHDQKSWRKTNQHSLSWEKKVTKLFEHYTAQTPGSFVERKEWSIVWHYRGAAPFYAQKNLVILKKLLKPKQPQEITMFFSCDKNLNKF